MTETTEDFVSEDLLSIHEEALERFEECEEAWSKIYQSFKDDYKFAQGEQWDPSTLKNRTSNHRSTLTYNALKPHINFIVNNARTNTPEIKIHPISEGANKNTAKILDGIIKSIQYKSNAKDAYVNALRCSVTGGFGAFKVIPELTKEGIEITIKSIEDPTSIYIDPNSEKSNYSDAEYGFVVKWISKKRFDKEYPNTETFELDKKNKSWFKEDQVQIVEYWVKNPEDGKFDQYIINGNTVLDSNLDYPGSILPIVFVSGERYLIDGVREFKGIVRDAKDIQKMLNYSKSETADYLTKSAKQQWMVEESMIADYQDIWDSANIESYNYLPYKATNGGKPTKIEPNTPPSGYMATSKEAADDIRAIIGIKDPTADIPMSQSGKAIALQISQGNIGSAGYLDSLKDSIKHAGEIILDLIPYYYSYPHIREIMGIDDQINTVELNTPYEENGELVMHDLSKGIYGVTISTGPSYESQRTEASDRLIELTGKYPQMMQFAGDLIVRNLDFKGADELADRLRAGIPPNILAASNPTNEDSKDTQIQILTNQMNQIKGAIEQDHNTIQSLQAQLQQAQMALQEKESERQFELLKIQKDQELQIRLKQMELEFKRGMVNVETHQKLALDNNETVNNLREYEGKKEIDMEFDIPAPLSSIITF